VEFGQIEISNAVDYNSHNTNRLDISGMQVLLRKLDFLKSITHRES
jgi:UDP-glucose 4-epimerase